MVEHVPPKLHAHFLRRLGRQPPAPHRQRHAQHLQRDDRQTHRRQHREAARLPGEPAVEPRGIRVAVDRVVDGDLRQIRRHEAEHQRDREQRHRRRDGPAVAAQVAEEADEQHGKRPAAIAPQTHPADRVRIRATQRVGVDGFADPLEILAKH